MGWSVSKKLQVSGLPAAMEILHNAFHVLHMASTHFLFHQTKSFASLRGALR